MRRSGAATATSTVIMCVLCAAVHGFVAFTSHQHHYQHQRQQRHALSRQGLMGLPGSGATGRASRPGTAVMALKDLARKAKEAEVTTEMEALRAAEPDNEVFKILSKVEAGESLAGEGGEFPLSSVLRKRKGTLSVVAEYRRVLKSGFIDGILSPALLCPLFRNGGASCVAIATEKQTGGCTAQDMQDMVTDNRRAEGDFPGPMPIIVRDLILSEFQIARAKASGATGVTVGIGLVGEERCGKLIDFCKHLGMEAVVQTTNKEEIESAVKAGASIIAVVGKLEPDAAELIQYIPEEVLSVVHVDRRSDEANDEIEDCWELRDHGYNTIWVSEVLYKSGQLQGESAEAIIKAIRAKSSKEYHRASGMSGKGEGAREYLGYLAQ